MKILTCSLEWCSSKHYGRGYCQEHYRQIILGHRKRHTGKCAFVECTSVANAGGAMCKVHWNRANRYKLTVIQLNQIVISPCSLCGCVIPVDDVHIDHDHSCCPGKTSCGECLRGVLCRTCNLGLGYFGDNPEKLLLAIAYLKYQL